MKFKKNFLIILCFNIDSVSLELWAKIGSFTMGSFAKVGSVSVRDWGKIS